MQNMGADIAIRRFATRILMLEGIPGDTAKKISNIRDEMLDEIAPPASRVTQLQFITPTRSRQ